jgi:hypothetical protein
VGCAEVTGAIGKVLSIVVALAGEVAVLRDRLDTVERLLDSGQPVTREAIERYFPDESVRKSRDEWRQAYLTMVFRALHEEREPQSRDAYEKVVKAVEGD